MARDRGHDRTTSGSPSGDQNAAGRSTLLERREYLKLGATAVAAATGGTAITGVTDAATEHHGITFDRVLDAVDDLGMDDNGTDPVDDAFEDAVGSDTLIEFPPGTYRWEDIHDHSDLTNFGVRSTTGNAEDVTFTFPSGFGSGSDRGEFLQIRESKNVLLEGFEVAQTSARDIGAGVVMRVADGGEIRDVHFTGFSPEAGNGPGQHIYASIETTDGVGHISNVYMDGGGVESTYPNRMMGIFAGNAHVGEWQISNCDIREMGSSGIRFTSAPGAVKVENSYFENVDNGAVRLSGNDHAGGKSSWIKQCEFVNDDSRVQYLPDGESYENADMIRVDSSGSDYYGLLIEDCTFEYRSHPDEAFARGCIARPGFGDHGSFTVRGCTMRIDANDVEAIDAKNGSDTAPRTVLVEDTHVTGEQSQNDRESVFYIGDSDDSEVRNCCISLPNGENGVTIADSSNCLVESSDILVPGEATKFVNSDVSTSGITNDGACRLPGDDSTSGDSTSDDSTDDGSTKTDLTNTLSVTGTGTATNYRFTVDGDLAADPDASNLESWDTISDSTADGWVTTSSQTDTFRFSGSVTSFEFVEGEATVTLNGEQVDPATFVDDSTSDDSTSDDSTSDDSTSDDSTSDDRTIRITGTDTTTNYRFTVSGDLAADPDASNLESWDTISDSTADGWVTTESQVDTFQFTGDVVSFEFVEGEATVEVDGEVVDPATLGYDRTLTIVGYDADTTATYEATVSGEIRSNPNEGELSNSDTTFGSTVEDTISTATHSYIFDGDVTYFSLGGHATVYIDGQQVDAAALESGEISTYENEITVDGSTADGGTTYEFAVTGDVSRSPDLASAETEDTVSGGSVSGSVSDDADAYRFTGDLVSLDVDGSASVSFSSISDAN